MTTTGKVSNYFDSGYNVTTLNLYDSNNIQVSTSISSSDIYNNTQNIGVILCDEGGNSYPVYCSAKNLGNIGILTDADDYYIVYPGWGFTLWHGVGYTEEQSRTYINNTTSLQLFSTITPIDGVNVSQNIYTTSDILYSSNNTSSIKVYFRGVEVTLNGIS
jgi:hypothetical protein